MTACPECAVDAGERAGSRSEHGGLVVRFRCGACDHEWEVPF